MLFNSKEDLIPSIRADLDVYPVKSEDRELIYFHDLMGYAKPNFVLQKELAGLLALLDENRSVNDIHKELIKHQSDVGPDQILNFIQHLDNNRILFSPSFKKYSVGMEEQFEQQNVRDSSCDGSSYPGDPVELTNMLDAAFESVSAPSGTSKAKALYAPHIDPRVGLQTYVKAFAPLKDLKPSKVIILATSHYAGSYFPFYENTPFIASRKSFKTPLGESHTDAELLDKIEKNSEQLGCSMQDRAHRIEHSIEMHMLFLHYMWDHPFEIVPILVDSFEQLLYKEDGELGKQVNNMSQLLGSELANSDDAFFLISGDLAHIGRKFGDKAPARSMLQKVKLFDGEFLDHASSHRPEELLKLIRKENDSYRICGFPPLFTFLKSLQTLDGAVTSYQVWDEAERESAVSFGSILYK
ncbi:MAG: AmmeMemoRadiSam system protein B [Balneolales bacterium]